MDVKEQIALSILKGAGGDVDKDYTSTDAIYRDVESIYRSQDNRQDVEPLQVEFVDNGVHIYDDRNTQGYKPVEINVNVPIDDYYNSGFENGIEIQKSKLESIVITENGIYNKEDGYDEVEVVLDIPKPKIYNGFRFVSEGDNDYKLIKDIDFSQYDWSGVCELDNFFAEFESTDRGGLVSSDFDNFVENFNGRILSCFEMFYNSNALKEAPNFGDKTKNCFVMSRMFSDCSNLTYIPQFDTSNVIDTTYMFYNCPSLNTIPLLDTSNVVDMQYMFQDCSKLTTIPQLNTSNVTNMWHMFHNCEKLTTIPLLDTSNVTDMSYMFNHCTSLTSIPQLDTSKVTNMYGMFTNCTSLTSIPQLNTSNVTNMGYMFEKCTKLTSIPQLDTSKASSINHMFEGCTSLRSIPLLDCQKVTDVSNFLGYSNINTLTDLGGFKDLGKLSMSGISSSGFLDCATKLTNESLMNVINNLYDRKANGLSNLTIKLGSANLKKLTSEEKAIATNKGWNLS